MKRITRDIIRFQSFEVWIVANMNVRRQCPWIVAALNVLGIAASMNFQGIAAAMKTQTIAAQVNVQGSAWRLHIAKFKEIHK